MSASALPARFLQGVFPFVGRGLFESIPIDPSLEWTVRKRQQAQIVYVRLGNHSDDLIYLTLTANDKPIRHFPVGPPETRLAFLLAAERGASGTLILDVGIHEERLS